MSYKLIAMIPARLGSKRIPRKNLRYLGDKPLIQYPVELALQIPDLESIWVNTESDELGRAAGKLGVNFHKRPAELAADNTTNRQFTYQFMCCHECDYVIMMNTTSPLLRVETVRRFIDFVQANDYDTVLSVHSEKAEAFFQGKPVNFNRKEKVNSQYLAPIELTVWALTAWKREVFMKLEQSGQCPIFGGKLGTFPIPKDESCDLDTEEDWNIAEGMIEARRMREHQAPRYMEWEEYA